MDIFTVFKLFGGIGLFLYGMSVMGDALERVAGAKLEKTLEKLTSSPVKGVLLGAAVTAVIQSSAATSVMVVGFVNAGIMKLAQAVPVIMGANIGTTMTAQILRLGDISEGSALLTLLKPASFAPLFVGLGAAILLVSKKKRVRDLASILIGFGILFVGMTTIETTLAPLKDSESFRQLFFMFRNPLLGVALGAVVTCLLQSSSASVGLLQAISSTGTVAFSMAAPIIMGQNIGKCATVILASFGTNKKAKRAVYINVIVNIFGTAMFLVIIYGWQALVGFSFWDSIVNRGDIANFHTLFNVGTTLALMPFTNFLINLSGKLLHDTGVSKMDQELALLDDMFLKTPSLAVEQCKKVAVSMGETVRENFALCARMLQKYDSKDMDALQENESFLDRSETVLGEYLVKVAGSPLSDQGHLAATEIMYSLTDFERMGDYCVKIANMAEYNNANGILFSGSGQSELNVITAAVQKAIDTTVEAYRDERAELTVQVQPLRVVVGELEEDLRSRHVTRLQEGTCTIPSGISFVEAIASMDRITGHCVNVAEHLAQRLSGDPAYRVHNRAANFIGGATSEEFNALYSRYKQEYAATV